MKKFFTPVRAGMVVVVVIGLVLLITKCRTSKPIVEDIGEELVDTTESKQEHLKYGIPIDDFTEIKDKVKRGQSLSAILDKYGIFPNKVYEIVQKSKNVFNVKKIKKGNAYSVLMSKDSIPKPEFFIYEKSQAEYIVFDLQDTISVYKGERPTITESKSITGTIESSLWNALVGNGATPLLSDELSYIYQWTIDFFGIAKGDSFKVLYDQESVNGKIIGVVVKAAVFNHMGKDYYAFPFEQDGKISYFDENGENLQKSFLKAPLKFSRISSRFSGRRFHPVLKRYRAHHGVDYAAPTGTPVYSIGDGKIIKKGYQKRGGGRYIKIRHNSVYTTCYMHFSRFASKTSVGKRVKQGQVIGYVGRSGLATGPHLDFRVYKHGTPINPLRMKSPSKSPIKAENKEEYYKYRDLAMLELNGEIPVEDEVAMVFE
jgi:murein DD-endopeptidase MepM/ murein hydrolase activator NlpD